MKKKILGVTLIVTLVVVAAFNLNLNKSNAKGDLVLANVEALAEDEINLPEVIVACGRHEGRCWHRDCQVEWTPFSPIPINYSICPYFSGSQLEVCVSGVPC